MRKLNPHNNDSFEFYKEVVASKRNSDKDPDYKDRIEAHENTISDQFDNYDDSFFDADNLISLVHHGFTGQDKADLIKLYSYKSKKMQELKIAVTTTERNRLLNTCQNCTIGEVNSFDHFVNKEEFPEFSVHPKNLFPSCTKCNSYKGQEWREHGQIKYLNLYFDELPEEQYLFVDVQVFNNDVVTTDFYIANPNGIDPIFFSRIEKHYNNLRLCERFKENADNVISSLENTIKICAGKLSLEDITNIINEKCEKDMVYYGFNYWKSILEKALINNDNFIEIAM
ncbi:HNH endonuclease [Tenacibaculum maritimum]|uniref:HNH endonuclease n=1 Tax=Tenacibaculum maritimum TaxID=107401 RepID=UPI0012E521EF|nr:HNH endonuclease [Tenacibaculum maritimum]MCD9562441.1 hypothetical protein [Tenacibaculum maritimum]MCD9564483.1 hypothetical protein [Tenacibaculum maritimum]MCD9578166.1 hypothetical protein [Tenacibaculum maritimum]MCD9595561.1 hypothetical protein [Tenacibaculum maritimum]MCD9612775.1 hypothetical protein [Tenacibaculum maritimum]